VVFCAGVKIGLSAGYRRGDALVFSGGDPTSLVVVLRLDFAGKDFPAPLIDDQTERQEGDLVEGLTQQDGDVGVGGRKRVEQADCFRYSGVMERAMVSPMAS